MNFDFTGFLIYFPIVLFSITIHEAAHAWAAFKMGDPTANYMGRLTLNPVKHIDPIGTLLVPLMLHMNGFPPFGWAKPVPVNFSQLKDKKLGYIAVGASGPLSNLLLAFFIGIVIRFNPFVLFNELFAKIFFLNMILAMFNMIPIPPLDGSRVLFAFLSWKNKMLMHQIERYSFIVLLVLMFSGAIDPIFQYVFFPVLKLFFLIITGYTI